jgi:DNA-binding response OmpR family regulator
MAVLVVEHVPFYGDLIRASFFSRGFTCFLSETASDAIAYVNSLKFDLVVIDSNIQGPSTLEDLLYTCFNRGFPVVLITDDAEDRYKYSKYKIKEFIPRSRLVSYTYINKLSDIASSVGAIQ